MASLRLPCSSHPVSMQRRRLFTAPGASTLPQPLVARRRYDPAMSELLHSAGEGSASPASGPGRPRPLPKRDRDRSVLPIPSRRVLGMRVDATSYAEAVRWVMESAESGEGGMVCVATTHMVMEGFDDPAFRALVNSAERVTPDGMPLVWALKRGGIPGASRVYGPELTERVCEVAAARGVPVGFLGGSPEVIAELRRRVRARHPKLQVPFVCSPPFRSASEAEDAEITGVIAASGIRILFVGLGCPKQERWMAAHRERLDCVMLGVGAAFDFLAGAKRQAPALLQGAGLEWLFRLVQEPRRLWRRYLVGNTRFLYQCWRARRDR
jgi:N-acetylglucosaminyldiphosphoundecaprenol N-acetyl-beta-D-mannosaminyltransferase